MADRELQDTQQTVSIPVYSEERFAKDSLSGFDMEQSYINCYPEVTIDPVTGEKRTSLAKRPGTTGTLSILSAVGAGAASHIHVKDQIVITQLIDVYVAAVFDSTRNKTYIVQYRPITGTATLLGDIGTTAWADVVHLTEYQQVNAGIIYPAVAISWKKADESVSRGYSVRSDGTVFTAATVTQITQVGFPDQQTPAKIITGPFQQMNGLVYIMCTDGSIYNSGGTAGTANDITTAAMWNTLSVILTYQSPDKGLGIYRYKHHLIAVSKNSIEFFNDAGNPSPASPLERTQQAFIKFGAVTSKVVINVADTLYWLSYGANNTIGMWKMEGYAPVKVSRAKQDNQIANGYHTSGNVNAVDLISLVINGKLHIGINGVQSYTMMWRQVTYGNQAATGGDTYKTLQNKYRGIGGTLFYNSTDDLWWAWSCMGDYTSRIVPAVEYPSNAAGSLAYHFTQYFFYDQSELVTSGDSESVSSDYAFKLAEGDQYNFANMVDDDPNGTDRPIACSVQFNTLSFGNQKRKTIPKLTLVFDHTPATGTHGADTNVYSISLIYRKGNAVSSITQNVERYITYPSSMKRYYFNNLGTARNWAFCVTSLSNDSFQLKGLEIDVVQGTH